MKSFRNTCILLLLLASSGTASCLFAAPGNLHPNPNAPAGSPLPPGTDSSIAAGVYALRDSVYMNEDIGLIEKKADSLAGKLSTQAQPSLGSMDRLLLLARVEFLAGRAFNEAGVKQKAIERFEAAYKYANACLAEAEQAPSFMALIKPLSELCLLKSMGFLISNGPLISKYAKQILSIEPGHPGATIVLAASKAYPPGIFGGNPSQAITMLETLIAFHPEGFEKDELFDIRTCMGTAYSKLGKKASAAQWFGAALELYPENLYAREQFAKVKE